MKPCFVLNVFLSALVVASIGCHEVDSHHTVVVEKSETPRDQDQSSEQDTTKPSDSDEGVKAAPENEAEAPPSGATQPILENDSFVTRNNTLDVEDEPYLTGENYQLGDKWSRNLTKAFHENHKTVIRGTVATDDGLVSSNFTVLDFVSDEEALFLAAVHALPECSEEAVVLRTKDRVMYGYCSGIYAVVPETDAVIFSLKFFDVNLKEELQPVSFATSVQQGDRLKFYTMGQDRLIPGYFPLYSDADIDCLLVSGSEKQIADPDPVNPIPDSVFWSLAVSCDVIHGDSGGIVVNRENQLVGMVWTGAFPKDPKLTTEVLLNLARENSPETDEIIWSGLNYAVPGYRIFQHLQMIQEQFNQQDVAPGFSGTVDSVTSHP